MTKAANKTLLVCTGALAMIGLGSGLTFHMNANASHHVVHSIKPSNDIMTKSSKKVLNGKQNIYSQPNPKSYLVAQKRLIKGKVITVIGRKRVHNNFYDEIQSRTGLKGWVNVSGVVNKVQKIKKSSTSKADLRNLHDTQANLIKVNLFTSLYNNGISNHKLMLKSSLRFLHQADKDNQKIRKPSLSFYGQKEINNTKRQFIITEEQHHSNWNTPDIRRSSKVGNQLNIVTHSLWFPKHATPQQKVSQLNVANKALSKATQINSKTRNKRAKNLNTQLINNMVRYYDTINRSLGGSTRLSSERDKALLTNVRQAVNASKISLQDVMRLKNNKPNLNNVKHMINQSNNYMRIAQNATNRIQGKSQKRQANKILNSIINM